jgi:hypothetical protein
LFIGGQVSAKQVNKIGGESVPQERSHELQRSTERAAKEEILTSNNSEDGDTEDEEDDEDFYTPKQNKKSSAKKSSTKKAAVKTPAKVNLSEDIMYNNHYMVADRSETAEMIESYTDPFYAPPLS